MNTSTIPASSPRNNLYQRITDRIAASLAQGVRPWVQPWTAGSGCGPISRPLRHNGSPYAGVNVLALWCTSVERGYVAPTCMTFRQALELGACVRKGETGTLVVYSNSLTVDDGAGGGDESESSGRKVRFLKGYTVFNVEQIDGLPETYAVAAANGGPNQSDRIARVDHFLAHIPVPIRHGGDRAFYAPAADYIQLPPFEAFRDAQAHAATALHEMVHASGHKSRLARDLGKRFGDEAYAAEELIAEIGSAFLCADLGIALDPRDDHAAYIATWLAVLRRDSRAIFLAAAQAQRAVEYLHSLAGRAAVNHLTCRRGEP
jgi:antirestriction protein ArdC